MQRVEYVDVDLKKIGDSHYIRIPKKFLDKIYSEIDGELIGFQVYLIHRDNSGLENKRPVLMLFIREKIENNDEVLIKSEVSPLHKILKILNMPILDFLNMSIDEIIEKVGR